MSTPVLVPIVDVLIPAYNAASTVRDAIASIQRQTLADILIHVVDDGSTDETPAILAELARDDPRLRVHKRANGGIVSALNFGLTFCEAEFLARHDADDLAYPDRLAVQVDYLRAHPEVVAVGAGVRHIGADGALVGSVAILAPPDDADAFRVPSREPYIIHPFLTVRRDALAQVGGYRFAFHAEDTDLYWRLAEIGRLVNLTDLLGEYRLHGASISAGSIVNGRIMAIGSQLAALSARRRRAGRLDLVFPPERLSVLKQAGTLAAMIDIVAADLDAAERTYLEQATAAKLLDLTAYRPYEPDHDDCVLIASALRTAPDGMTAADRSLLERQISGAAARLAAAGAWRSALALMSARRMPAFLARLALRTGVPSPLRRWFQRRETREMPKK